MSERAVTLASRFFLSLRKETPGDLDCHRVRHVKCDETKPFCLRCTSTGRRCDGYLPPKSWLIQINPDGFEDGGERRAFQYFRERTGPELSRFYDESFWNNLVPQASHSQRAIKHCLVAISSFHEKLESIQPTSDASFQREYSLTQYGKAMQLLRRAPSTLSVEETLINCILFVWFENLQNNLRNSFHHLKSGLKIVAEARRSQPQKTTPMIETVLVPMLERLKLKADAYALSGDQRSPSDLEYFIPERFWNVEQACSSFTHLINWTCTVLGHITISRNNSDNWHQRSSKLARRLAGFDLYSARLEDLLRATRSAGVQNELQAVIDLKIRDLVVRIIVSVYLQLRECAYDRHKMEFVQIVELCDEYLRIESMSAKTTPTIILSQTSRSVHKVSVLPHLLFTSAHCRDPSIRQRVISLLNKYPQAEGVMHSHLASKLAERIAEIEKQDLKRPASMCDTIVEADRIRVLSLSFYKSEDSGVSTQNTHDAEICSPSCEQDGCSKSLTRIKISFIRCAPTATEQLIEEEWIDETDMSLPVSSISLHPRTSFHHQKMRLSFAN
jgi:hypothetical protein